MKTSLFLLLIALSLHSFGQWPVYSDKSVFDLDATVEDLITDVDGNIYVLAGYQQQTLLGTYALSSAPANTAFYVAKYDQSGALIWIAYNQSDDAPYSCLPVDMEYFNGSVYVLYQNNTTSNINPFSSSGKLFTVTGGGAAIDNYPMTYNPPASSPYSNYGVAIIPENGSNIKTLEVTYPALDRLFLTCIQPYEDHKIYLGGRVESANMTDAFVGEFNPNGGTFTLDLSTNYTTIINGWYTDIYFDLEVAHANGTDYLVGTGSQTSASAGGTSLPASGGQYDYDVFHSVFELPAVNSAISAIKGNSIAAQGRAIDIRTNGNDIDVYTTGKYTEAIPSYAVTSNLSVNAFVSRHTFNTGSQSFTFDWASDFEDNALIYANGNDIVLGPDGNYLYATGEMLGEVMNYQSCSQALPGTRGGWMLHLNPNTGSCAELAIKTHTTLHHFTSSAITTNNSFVYTAGEYYDDLTITPSSTGVLPNNNVGEGEMYIARYDPAALTYFKKETAASATTGNALTLSFYPNPAENELTLAFSTPLEDAGTMLIYSVDGKLILTRPLIAGASQETIDLSALSAGLYTMNIRSATHSFNETLIVR